jgi:hypothetical protein
MADASRIRNARPAQRMIARVFARSTVARELSDHITGARGFLRSGVTLGNFQVALFCDNVFDSHTTINYELSQTDANNPSFNPLVPTSLEQNAYTWRPRTVGITATFRN